MPTEDSYKKENLSWPFYLSPCILECDLRMPMLDAVQCRYDADETRAAIYPSLWVLLVHDELTQR